MPAVAGIWGLGKAANRVLEETAVEVVMGGPAALALQLRAHCVQPLTVL